MNDVKREVVRFTFLFLLLDGVQLLFAFSLGLPTADAMHILRPISLISVQICAGLWSMFRIQDTLNANPDDTWKQISGTCLIGVMLVLTLSLGVFIMTDDILPLLLLNAGV